MPVCKFQFSLNFSTRYCWDDMLVGLKTLSCQYSLQTISALLARKHFSLEEIVRNRKEVLGAELKCFSVWSCWWHVFDSMLANENELWSGALTMKEAMAHGSFALFFTCQTGSMVTIVAKHFALRTEMLFALPTEMFGKALLKISNRKTCCCITPQSEVSKSHWISCKVMCIQCRRSWHSVGLILLMLYPQKKPPQNINTEEKLYPALKIWEFFFHGQNPFHTRHK